MHHRTLLAFMLIPALHAAAQIPTALSSLPAVTIRIQDMLYPAPDDGSGTPTCFSHFEVLDLRADSSRIGIHTCIPNFGRNHDRQLLFTGSASTEIAGYLNRHFTHTDGRYAALVILRTLWLSDANADRADLMRYPELRLERTHIRIKAEVYAIRDGRYFPVLRFDSLQTAWKKRILAEPSPYFEWGRNLALLLHQLADSASRLIPEKEDQSRWVGLDDIRQFNTLRFNPPIGETSPTRGVYANFEEFRNNRPSIKDFDVKLQNHERLLYIREQGTDYYSHDAWGYCDGKDIYIMRDGVLCPAWKEGNAFYIPAGARKSTTGGTLTDIRGRDYRQRTIYFVDMDTGDMY